MGAMPQLRRHLALALAVVMFVLTGPLDAAHAALVTTGQAIEAGAALGERDRVAAFVTREDVRAQMAALGVDPAEAASRVASLSDAEVRQIAGQLDRLPAGQSAVGAVIGAALLDLPDPADHGPARPDRHLPVRPPLAEAWPAAPPAARLAAPGLTAAARLVAGAPATLRAIGRGSCLS